MTHPSFTRAERRSAFIQSLRDAADFFEAHPNVAVPRYTVMNVFLNTREEIVEQARAASWEKVYNDAWFTLLRRFGDDLTVEVNASRETVCRKVVTGSHVVPALPERTIEDFEWVCDDEALLEAK